MYKEGSDIEMENIFPSEIERVRKQVRRYYFDAMPTVSLDFIVSRLKPILEDIKGFEPIYYQLFDVEPVKVPSSRYTHYKGIVEVTYYSQEREIFILR